MKISLILDLSKIKLTTNDYNTLEYITKDKILLQSFSARENSMTKSMEFFFDSMNSSCTYSDQLRGRVDSACSEQLRDRVDSACSEQLRDGRIILTDSDEGIARHKAENVPVIAWSHAYNSKESLMGTPWMILDLQALSGDYLEEVYHRFHGIAMRILETDRCYLKELGMEDFENLLALDQEQDEKSRGRFFPIEWTQTEESLRNSAYPSSLSDKNPGLSVRNVATHADSLRRLKDYLFQYLQNQYPFYGYGIYGAYALGDDCFLGIAGFSLLDCVQNVPDQISPNDEEAIYLEIGYAVKKSVRQKGYACEWVSALLEYAKKKQENGEWEPCKILARIHPDHLASIKVAKKCGLPILYR